MTKLGTPIGAGPNIAKVVVGLAAVGVPPWSKAALPPSPPFAAGCTPPVAGGAVTPPPAPTPVPGPFPSMPLLRVTPPASGASAALRDEPLSTPLLGSLGVDSGAGSTGAPGVGE